MFILVEKRYYKVSDRSNGTSYYSLKGKRIDVVEEDTLVEEKPKPKAKKKDGVKMADDEFYSPKTKGAVKGLDIKVVQNGNRYSLTAVDKDGNKLRKFTSKVIAEKYL